MTRHRRPVRLLLSDVDGTLVTSDKTLSPATIAAAGRLREAGVRLAVTSGRPPRGMEMLVEPLSLELPLGGFNGGLVVSPAMEVLEQRVLPGPTVATVLGHLTDAGLDPWVFRGADWFVPDRHGPHVARESRAVGFGPTEAPSFLDALGGSFDGVAKVTGVSDDPERVAAALASVRAAVGDHVAASCSQPYYLDVTHPDANKGCMARWLADRLDLAPEEIATIGDMSNDVLMFAHSGVSIAMGNATAEVHRAARHVTRSNDDDGWAHAVDRFVLPAAGA